MDDKSLDFEQIDRDAVKYLRKHLDPSLIKEYDDDEIYIYVMDLCDDYFDVNSESQDEMEVWLNLEDMATYVSKGLGEDLGVKMHEDDACEVISTLYDYYAECGLVDFMEPSEEQEGGQS